MARHGDIEGVRNPGMSVWPFVALSYVFGSDGFRLTQSVRVLSVLALPPPPRSGGGAFEAPIGTCGLPACCWRR